MVICRWCKRPIANAGNPQIIYSNCNDCRTTHDTKRKERLNGEISKIPNERENKQA